LSVLALAFFLEGCPKSPGGSAVTAPGIPPAPKEFAAIESLKDIHFDFDKYDIRRADAKVLDEDAKWLKTNTNALILIEGHCDERGTSEYNLALGDRRAKATMNYLVSQGVQPSRITLISYGKERPQCTAHNEQCWARTRRAHFRGKAG
jgi:peptidoglycan-associated lipoprotein